MKTFLALLIIVLFIGCNNKTEKQKIINVVDENLITEQKKDTVLINKKEFLEIQELSQAAKDVAIYFITHKDKWTASNYTFNCGKYKIWIANGYSHIRIYSPVEYEFNKIEKDYFWKMYKTYQRQDMRLYEYESKIEFILNDL